MAPTPGLPGLPASLSRTRHSWLPHRLRPPWPAHPCSHLRLTPPHLPPSLLFGGPLVQPPASAPLSPALPMLLPRRPMTFPPLSPRFMPTPDLTLIGEGPHPKRTSLTLHVLASTPVRGLHSQDPVQGLDVCDSLSAVTLFCRR